MNAVELEMELMDPIDYWLMQRSGWHVSGDMANDMHLPNYSAFCYELEDAAKFMLDVFGVNYN